MHKIIDLHHHLDTLQKPFQARNILQKHNYKLGQHLRSEIQTIISVPIYVQAWQDYQYMLQMIKSLKARIKQLGSEAKLITAKSDLNGSYKLGIIIHIESARTIKEPEWQLPQLFEQGVRGIIPVHFIDNHLGQSSDDPLRRIRLKRMDQGLTDKGFKFIEKMNSLNMWTDVSHATDKTAIELLDTANHVMASHIGIRDITNRKRNQTITFFKKLAKKNGIFGLVPWQHLIGNGKNAYKKHLEFAFQAGLESNICIGSDLGAPIKTHGSIKDIYDCAKIIEDSTECSQNIIYKNAFSFFERALPR